MTKWKWIVQYPKFGGLPIGFENIFGPPELIIQNMKDNNDKHYFLNRPDIPILESPNFSINEVEIDFVPDIFIALPGCAGLQSVGTNHSEKSSLEYQKNDEIIRLVQLGMDLKSRVICIEQSDGMFSNMGQNIRTELERIQKETEYSIHYYKTNTLNHGIPQNRERVFVIFYRDQKCPIFDFETKDRYGLKEYLELIPKDSLYYNEYYRNIDLSILDNVYEYFGTTDLKEIVKKVFKEKSEKIKYISCLKIIRNIGIENFLEKVSPNDYIKNRLLKGAKNISENKGIWDWQPYIVLDNDYVKPVIYRNYQVVHPDLNRIMNIREFMWLMGLPHDYKIANVVDKHKHISRNVPVPVSEFIASQIKKYLNSELSITNQNILKQDNIKRVTLLDESYKDKENYLTKLGI